MSKLWTDAQITLLKEAKDVYFALKKDETPTLTKAKQQDNPQWDELLKKIEDAIKEVETSLASIFKNIVLLKGEDNYPQLLQELRDKIGYTQPEKDEQNAIFALCAQLETEAKAATDEKYIKIAEGKFNTLRSLDRQISYAQKLVHSDMPLNAKDKKATKEAVSKTLETTYSRKDAVRAELAKFEKMSETECAQHQTEIANLRETSDLLENFTTAQFSFCDTDFTIGKNAKTKEPKYDDVETAYSEWLSVQQPNLKDKNGFSITKDTDFSDLPDRYTKTFNDDSIDSHYNKVREFLIKKNYGARFGFNEKTKKLAIELDANGSKMEQEARTIHELQHLIQAKKGQLGFYNNGKIATELYDIWDEVDAYKMQFAAVPESFAKYKPQIKAINEITPEWVKNQNDYYRMLPNVNLSSGTLMSEIFAALADRLDKSFYQDKGLTNEKGELKPKYRDKPLQNYFTTLEIKTL